MAETMFEVEVAEVGLAPVKSMEFLHDVELLKFDEDGLFGDREFMLVEAESHTNELFQKGHVAEPGHFLSQREDPLLAKIRLSYDESHQALRFVYHNEARYSEIFFRPGEIEGSPLDVSVWSWNGSALDQGDVAANWFSEVVGRPVRLVRLSDNTDRFVEGDESKGRVGFADGYPLLVINDASVQEVNDWLEAAGKPTVPADRYRANIILKSENLEAFGEDNIGELSLTYNGLAITLVRARACARCPVPDTDQQTGIRRRDVRSVLGKNGRSGTDLFNDESGIFFGQNFIVRTQGLDPGDTIQIVKGAKLQAAIAEHPNWVPLDKK